MLSETYLCKSKQVFQTKAGKSYYSLILQDKSGTLDGKIWDLGPGIDHFDSMDYIRVDGQIVSFQNALQMNIRRVHKCHEGEYDPKEYMPCTNKDIKEMYQELTCFIKSMKNETASYSFSTFNICSSHFQCFKCCFEVFHDFDHFIGQRENRASAVFRVIFADHVFD